MSRVRFVLVRPRNPLNIGAAARAVANFGFSDLAAVDPFEPVWKEARAAVGAEAVLESARALTLDQAVADRHLVLGTHDGRRRGGPPRLDLPELGAFLKARLGSGRLAVVFGQEKSGLTNEDLSRCHAALSIPTDRSCPSMNLAQAVAVVAYELAKLGRAAPARAPQDQETLTAQQRESLIAAAVVLCRKVGYRAQDSESSLAGRFRAVLLRRPLERAEAAVLQALLRRLNRGA